MTRTIVQTNEVYNFDELPNPLSVGHQPLTFAGGYDTHYHPQVGELTYKNASFPHMHVVDMKWKVNESITMINPMLTNAITFVFQVQGENTVKYFGIGEEMETRRGEHYMIFSPTDGYHNQAISDTYLEVMTISLDKDFFASSIGAEERWSEEIQKNLYLNRTFRGADRPLETTPQMWQLLRELREINTSRPLQNLLVQSKTLELVALHLDQFRKPETVPSEIKDDDAEKLHHLKTYLDANFLSELSLTQLSRQFLLNEFKVKKGFKLMFGSSVFNYLRKVRMEYGANLLMDQSLSVDEVSDILGYEHAQHFSTAFKNFMGVSPSQYLVGKRK